MQRATNGSPPSLLARSASLRLAAAAALLALVWLAGLWAVALP